MLEGLRIEKDSDAGEYVAFCDELRAVASGATEEEALANLLLAVAALFDRYGG